MSTLAETFLQDLEDLESDEEERQDEQKKDEDDVDMDDELDLDADGAADLSMLGGDSVKDLAKLLHSARLREVLENINKYSTTNNSERWGNMENHPEYQVVVAAMKVAADIDDEIVIVHKFIRDHYARKFQELENMVVNPLDYARVVKAIGNEMDITQVNLEDILPSATIMVVTVTGSTTGGEPLPQDELDKVVEACDMALALDEAKTKILNYVESRMTFIAPNVSAIVGSAIAAQLMGVAGGLTALSQIPACNLLLLGRKKNNLVGMSTAGLRHAGFILQCDLIRKTPPDLHQKCARVIAGKVTLAARVDAFNEDQYAQAGNNFRAEIEKKIEKWQEPPPAKQPKPLPAPDDRPKKKRGGKRLRKMKERLGLTDMRKQANRMIFGEQEEEFRGTGKGAGALGLDGSGKIRVAAVDNQKLAKAIKRKLDKRQRSSGQTSGLSSSLAFTPVQGIELENPDKKSDGTASKYFSGGFQKLHRTLN